MQKVNLNRRFSRAYLLKYSVFHKIPYIVGDMNDGFDVLFVLSTDE